VLEFNSLPLERKADTRYLHAHRVPFGIHELLPQQANYITLLRNPVNRVISGYFYHLRRPPAEHLGFNGLSLRDYACSNAILGDSQNGQTRVISGVKGEDWVVDSRPLSSNALEVAKENLRQHFTLVGIVERFDESLILLKRSLGWKIKDCLYVKRNIASNHPRIDMIDVETIKLIEAHNQLDIQLYEFARQMFEERISQQDSSFRRELQIFRICNRLYGLFIKLFLNNKLVVTILALARGQITITYICNKILNGVRSATGKYQ